jgi:Uma2 family endonuclease
LELRIARFRTTRLENPDMAAPRSELLYTVDEYLALERAADERHVFLDGRIHAMAGESGEHRDISVNLVGTLYNQLKGTPCRAGTKDTKVRSGPVPHSGRDASGMFSYPDIVVICGESEYHDAYTDVILNPAVIIEVLSPAT